MKKNLILFFLVCIGIHAIGQTIINDPNAELRTVSSFDAIEVSGGIDLFISQGDEEAMAVSASNSSQRDAIKSTVQDGVLKISYGNDGKMWVSGNKKLRAYVSFKSLVRLKASHGSDVTISGVLKSDEFSIELIGASDLKGKLEANKLNIEQAGASDAKVSGEVTELFINASGASNFQGYDLHSELCTVNASGASDVRITVNKELNANATGASSVKYHGNASIHNMKTTGGGKVRQ